MRLIQDHSGRQHRLLAVSAATAIAFAFFALGALLHGYALLEKYPPDWTIFGWARTTICALTGALLLVGLKPGKNVVRKGSLLLVEHTIFGRAFPVILLVTLATVAIIMTIPEILNQTVREGQFLSISTQLTFVAALVVLVLSIRRAWVENRGDVFGIKGPVIISVMTLVVALILMEEMSWGRYWLALGMPEGFGVATQSETSLHGHNAYRFELAYYSAAVLLFVVLPYCWPKRTWNWLNSLSFYIPPRAFAIFALPVCGLVFEAWNVIPYQIWFFLGLFIASDMAISPHLPRLAHRVGAAAMAMLLLSSQVIFLVHGPNLVDGYELSEVREFVISALVLVYASWLFAVTGYQPSQPKQIRWD